MSNLFLAKYMGFMIQMIGALYMLTIYGLPPSLMDIKTYGLHFVTVVLMTYMYCYGGAVIYDQSLSVAEAAYSMKWDEKGQTSLRKDVAFIILRAQKPELFTAGYFHLNMEAFVRAMQNVFSVYGLLATLAADEIMAKQISKEIIRS
ncbi:odorant receptor 45b-like [Atheta coriaria]|uniref:odorant receptor 45b-like n=1 Tax=Dalotia coriaria TaxID=877792 RepID=UPI0031F44366